MQNSDKIKEKIRLLLNLAAPGSGATEGEVSNAMSRVEALLEKYNLSLGDVADVVEQRDATEMMQEFTSTGNVNWKRYLICDIARSCMCFPILHRRRNGSGVYLFGRRCNIEAALMMMTWITPQIELLLLEETSGFPCALPMRDPRLSIPGFRNSFLWGAVNRINERLIAMRQVRIENDPNTRALVTDLSGQARDAAYAHFEHLGTHRASGATNRAGYAAGRMAGDKVTFSSDSHVGTGGPLRLGPGR